MARDLACVPWIVIPVTTSLNPPTTTPPGLVLRAPRKRIDCRISHRYSSTVRFMCLGANRTSTL